MDTQQPIIVVGVAGREDSAAAVRYAADECHRRHLPVVLVHVLHPMLAGPDADLIAVTNEPVLDRAHQMIEEVAAELRNLLGPDAPVSTRLVVGHPAPALSEVAQAAVIVLQPERMGQVTHIPTYSVTSSVAARPGPPVVAVPLDWSEPEPGMVTVGVDADGGPGHLLTAAFEEAQSRGVGLRVVHAWTYSVYDDVVYPGEEAQRHSNELAERIRAELGPLANKFSDVAVDLVVHHGRPADALVAESRRTSLVVVGRHRTSRRTGRHLGSIGRAVLREARCPVMVVDPVDRAWVAEDSLS